MTDKEIIKALEFCRQLDDECLCKICPYFDVDYCGKALVKDALDLINRQKAEIEELKLICDKERADRLYLSQKNKAIIAGQETLQKALAKKDREVERLTAEKDQLIKTFGECQAEATREILKTEKEIERLNNNISAMAVTTHNCAKETEAEAIRAFAERLKKECLIDRGYEILHEGTIDSLAKKMTEVDE